MTGLIADITRASMHDGPGFRTVVFLKGCPLNCAWCHNPECISFSPQELYYAEKCVGCGRCGEGCVTGARVKCGTEMSVDDVMEVIMQEQPYYGTMGGVTFSGGEPMAQKAFVSSLADACRKENIRTAMETSLIYFDEAVLSKMDLVMADLKIWDECTHRTYTGVSNKPILENFKKLDALNIPIIVRTPVIPGIEQGIEEISAFLKTLKNVEKYELLPYHPLADTKCQALGMAGRSFEVPSKAHMEGLKRYEFRRTV